jgi:hypothetical protein
MLLRQVTAGGSISIFNMRFFSEIILIPEIPEGGPAIVNRHTGRLRLSEKYWHRLPELIKKFILYHELGHLNAGKKEEDADSWAICKWIEHGNPVSAALEAQWDVFSFDQEGHIIRLRALFDKAKHLDFHINGNTKLKL